VPNNEASFNLPPQIGMYPIFLFHLRRGGLVNTAGVVPDQTVFYRYYLLKECASNCLTMIQPALDQYTFTSDPTPVPLTEKAMEPECLLLLDTFFHTLIWYGPQIAAWRQAGYHEQPEYEGLKELLKAPESDIKSIIKNRFPRPHKLKADPKTGDERYLKAVMDPDNCTPSNLLPRDIT